MRSKTTFWLFVFLVAFQSVTSAHDLTSTDVDAFLDGILPLQIESADIAGAVVVVVKDGKVFFAKGYGYSDVAKKKPVSVDSTLFRIGSIGKLFTWTSVMQLVEQGKLDLDRDINSYLDFKIPDAFNKPITLRHLMTHSAGFEEAAKDLLTERTDDPKQLGSYLRSHIPRRIFPPGATPSYSNYSTTLAGYIVERASLKPYATYVDQEILQPLGMLKSTVIQPLPAKYEPFMSKGYVLASDEPQKFEVFSVFPAGSMSSTGQDMARFMIAHLQEGRFEDRQILRPETIRLMHAPQLVLDKNANAAALGFYEESRNGLRIIGHAGDTVYFHSDLHLIKDQNLGFYISYNSLGRSQADHRTNVWLKFLDRYFPYVPPVAAAKGLQNAETVSGRYLVSRRSQGGIFDLLFLLQNVVVSPQSDGTIEVDQLVGPNGKPKRWREIKPFVFRDVNGADEVVFKRDSQTSSIRMIVPTIPYPLIVFDSLPWYRSSQFVVIPVGFTFGVLLLKLLLWPVAAIVRRHYGRKLDADAKEKRLRRVVRIICAMNLLILSAYAFFVVVGFESLNMLNSKYDPIIRIFQAISVLAVVGSLVVIYSSYRTWLNRDKGLWVKLQETFVALACIGFVWMILQGNLLDFSLRY